MNLVKETDTRRAANATAAGTGDTINGTVIDMQNYDAAAFYVMLGTIATGGVATVRLQQGALSDGSDMANMTGQSVVFNDTDDNLMAVLEVNRPIKRYVRCTITRATANVTIDGAVCVLHGGRKKAPAAHSTIRGAVVVGNSPA